LGAGYGTDLLLRPAAEKTITETTTKTGAAGTNTVTQSAQTVTTTATTTKTVTAPPATLSYRPPLSQSVQATADKVIQTDVSLHTGETLKYTHCSSNGCTIGSGGPCLLEVHVSNGVMTAIDVADPINKGNAREDVGDDAVSKEMIQMRPCVKGRGWRKTIYAPDRLLYPMKSVGAKGEQKFTRITWTEALDTVANAIKTAYQKRGPYSTFNGPTVLTYAGNYSFTVWGASSYSGQMLADFVTLGVAHGGASPFVSDTYGSEVLDILNTKLIVGFGLNPGVTNYGAHHYLTLAHEKGTKIILVDPVLSMSAQTYADQWIPIRPGTDSTMMLAIANVLLKENLWDQNYVSKYVEPNGFQMWKDYVLGNTAGPDGKIDRTPEWAEPICAVPADTIRQLARLYAGTKPAWLRCYVAANRQMYGENQARMGAYLQAMTGNIGIAGGGYCSFDRSPGYAATSAPSMNFTRGKANYPFICLMNCRNIKDAILLKDQVDAGTLPLNQYLATIGQAQGSPVANIGVIWDAGGERVGLGVPDQNKLYRAMKKVDFVVALSYHSTATQLRYADIVLPQADPHFEDYQSFSLGGGMTNYFLGPTKVVQPPGEAKTSEWIAVALGQRFGVDAQYNTTLAPLVNDPVGWDAAYEAAQKAGYEAWAATDAVKPLNPPSWDDFKKMPIWRVPHTAPAWFPFWDKMAPPAGQGNVFDTVSGKIEFYSSFLADPNMAGKSFVFPQRKIDSKVCVGGSTPPTIPPFAQYVRPPVSYVSDMVKQYPLMMLTTHSFYRQHWSQDNNAWFQNEGRHAFWIHPADAKARGIKDGDTVWVHNDRGEITIPAYVTSRIMPGVVVVRHGTWLKSTGMKTTLSPDGLDTRGNGNLLTMSTDYPWTTGILPSTTMVEVAKVSGSS